MTFNGSLKIDFDKDSGKISRLHRFSCPYNLFLKDHVVLKWEPQSCKVYKSSPPKVIHTMYVLRVLPVKWGDHGIATPLDRGDRTFLYPFDGGEGSPNIEGKFCLTCKTPLP